MDSLLTFLWIFVMLQSAIIGDHNNQSDPQLRLFRDLLQDYDIHLLPIYDTTQKVLLIVDFNPILIGDLNEKDQVLSMFSWLIRVWKDERLVWNETDYDGVEFIFPSLNRIWTPDMTVENSAEEMNTEITKGDFLAEVSSKGRVMSFNAGKTVTSCQLDMTYFPFDQHKCIIKLSNWLYTYDQIRLQNKTYKLDMSFYKENSQWRVKEAYMLLTSVNAEAIYESIDVTFVLKRKPAYYMFNFVVPSAVLAMMSNLMFCLPPESGERISLGITVLLSFSVFQFMIMDKMPASSDSIPMLTIYLMTLMAMSSLSLVISVIIINKYHRSEVAPPAWLKPVTKNSLSSCCCKCSKRIKSEENAPSEIWKPQSDKQATPNSTDTASDWKIILSKLDTVFLVTAFVISLALFCGVFIGLSSMSADL